MNQLSKEYSGNPYQTLSRTGGWFAFFQAFSVVFAVASYYIWQNIFVDHNIKMILEGIHSHPVIYFMKLEPILLVGTLLQLPVFMGLWSVLRKTDNSNALIALAVGSISIVATLTTRPIIELFQLSSKYSSTNILSEQQVYLSAGEALLTQFNGTAWAVSIIFGGISSIIFGLIMRKSKAFRRATTWAMIISGFGALMFFIPVIGFIALFFLATIGGVLASILCGIDLLRYSDRVEKNDAGNI